MGCCEGRNVNSKQKDSWKDSIKLNSLAQDKVPIILAKCENWEELLRLSTNEDLLEQQISRENFETEINDDSDFNPIPNTLGSLSLALYSGAFCINCDIAVKYIEKHLTLVLSNLCSTDSSTIYYTIALLSLYVENSMESQIHQLINTDIFRLLASIGSNNSLRLSHKIYRGREKAQRKFLHNNGYGLIFKALYLRNEESIWELEAAIDLLVDKNNVAIEFNCRSFFTNEIFKVLLSDICPGSEKLLMLFEDYLILIS